MRNLARKLGRFISSHLLPRCPYPVLRGPARGARLILGSLAGEGGGASVYWGLVEPEQTLALSRLLKPGNTFLDVGANVGYYTILAARVVGPHGMVLAIEPEARNISFLYKHAKINHLENIAIVTAACSDGVGLSLFAAGSTNATGHLADGRNPYAPGASSIVPTVSIDVIVQRTGVRPDAIKIDVEGAELAVLMGASDLLAVSSPTILISTHSETLRKDCIHFLEERGYLVRPLKLDDANPTEHIAVRRSLACKE